MAAIVNTPYDDVFRTLLNDCSSLVIPLVNEIFHASYSGDETVEFYPNEHFINGQDGEERERVTDSCFGIRGEPLRKYHIECQSTADDSMLIHVSIRLSPIIKEGEAIACSVPSFAFNTSPSASNQFFPFSNATKCVSSSIF